MRKYPLGAGSKHKIGTAATTAEAVLSPQIAPGGKKKKIETKLVATENPTAFSQPSKLSLAEGMAILKAANTLQEDSSKVLEQSLVQYPPGSTKKLSFLPFHNRY